jgi:arsenite methyltransferase
MLAQSGFEQVQVGPPVDTFGGAPGEEKARQFDVHGYAFVARKPS